MVTSLSYNSSIISANVNKYSCYIMSFQMAVLENFQLLNQLILIYAYIMQTVNLGSTYMDIYYYILLFFSEQLLIHGTNEKYIT